MSGWDLAYKKSLLDGMGGPFFKSEMGGLLRA